MNGNTDGSHGIHGAANVCRADVEGAPGSSRSAERPDARQDVCLVAAHQRFLEQKGLVLTILSSVIISLLHGFVPRFLVAVTDTVAAIVVDILALIWALV